MGTAYKILDIKGDTFDEGRKDAIVTAYMKVKPSQGNAFWCFVPDFRVYFPYHPKPSKWGVGKELRKNLIGKIVDLKFSFVDLKPIEKVTKKEKKTFQEGRYLIKGKIIEKKPFVNYNNKTDPNFEMLILDSGINIKTYKNKYKTGEIYDERPPQYETTKIVGKVIEKKDSNTKGFEKLIIDCGISLKIGTKKGQFQVGDYISTKGILNAEIIGEPSITTGRYTQLERRDRDGFQFA